MNDVIEQQLVREFGSRATELEADPALAARVMERGYVVRRRRTVGASLVAGVAAAAVILVATVPALRGEFSAAPAPAHRGIQPDPRAVPASGPLRIGYAVNPTPSAPGPRSTVVVPSASGAKTVQLPARWRVERVAHAGSGFVIGGLIVESESGTSRTGSPFMAYVSAQGQVRQLKHLHTAAEPTTPDGLTWATVSLVSLSTEPTFQVDFVRVDTDTVVQHPADVPATLLMGMSGALGPRTLLLRDTREGQAVWTASDGATPKGTVPGYTALWELEDTSLHGSVLLFNPEGQLRLSRAQLEPGHPGAVAWTVPVEGSAGLPPISAISPSGDLVAVRENGGLSFLNAANGAVLARELSGNAARPRVVQMAWEDDRTLVIAQGVDNTFGWLSRCAALSGRCASVDVLPGELILAGS